MGTINIFDIASASGMEGGTWYVQNATGETPEPRTDFCLVSAAAPDNSSHNM